MIMEGQSSFNVHANSLSLKLYLKTLVSDVEGGQSSFDVLANC